VKQFSTTLLLLATFLFVSLADAHRSGCHRWHSCPSDRATYICGDTGHCNYCPDNQYCQGGKPKPRDTGTKKDTGKSTDTSKPKSQKD
jgi:hypothetical protein